ncbi:MAG TPA: HAD-IA family hydrolase [Gemmataceae bacterium]
MCNRSAPEVKAVAFDAVGTLLFPDPPAGRVYAEAARRHGSPPLDPADIERRFRTAFAAEEARDREAGWRTDAARERRRWRAIVAASLPEVADPDACFDELFAHFARPGAWRTPPGTAEVLGDLARRGTKVIVASNYDARLRDVVRGLPALGAVGGLVISSEVGWRKPAPEFFRAVADRAGCAPGEVLFVGDDPENDFRAASQAGMRAVLYDPGGQHPSVAPRVRALTDLLRFI